MYPFIVVQPSSSSLFKVSRRNQSVTNLFFPGFVSLTDLIYAHFVRDLYGSVP